MAFHFSQELINEKQILGAVAYDYSAINGAGSGHSGDN
jgi:hypothetical protein